MQAARKALSTPLPEGYVTALEVPVAGLDITEELFDRLYELGIGCVGDVVRSINTSPTQQVLIGEPLASQLRDAIIQRLIERDQALLAYIKDKCCED